MVRVKVPGVVPPSAVPASLVPPSPVPPSAAAGAGKPVVANHAPFEPATKRTGARQGVGSATFARISALPVGVAFTAGVVTFVITGAPPSLVVMQLTITANVALGFVPC